jgi:hypothetical protein
MVPAFRGKAIAVFAESKIEDDYRTADILSRALLLYGVRAVFWLTVIFVFVSAEMPNGHALHLFPWDKAEHLPFLHRDCDIGDWFADAAPIAAALLPMLLDGWRRFTLGAQS